MGVLIADLEREVLRLAASRRFAGEAGVLEDESAFAQPVGMGHAFNQPLLSSGRGLMLLFESELHGTIFLLAFPIEYAEGAGEAVAEVVLRDDRFPCGGFWTGRLLRIGLVRRL